MRNTALSVLFILAVVFTVQTAVGAFDRWSLLLCSLNNCGLTGRIPPYSWTHWAVVRTGSILTLYVDGTAIVTTPVTGTFGGSTSAIYVGGIYSRYPSQSYFVGNIANLRVVTGTALYT